MAPHKRGKKVKYFIIIYIIIIIIIIKISLSTKSFIYNIIYKTHIENQIIII